MHVQFLGNNPDMLAANAAKVVELGAPAIDLNFGCPAKTVNRHRGGSVLLDEPDVVHMLIKAVRDAVPAHIPVSAKCVWVILMKTTPWKMRMRSKMLAQAG